MTSDGFYITLQPHVDDVHSVQRVIHHRNSYIGVPDHKPKFGYLIQIKLNGKVINSSIRFPGDESLTWINKQVLDDTYTFVEHEYDKPSTTVHIPIRTYNTHDIEIKAFSYTNNHIYQITSFVPTISQKTKQNKMISNTPITYHSKITSIQAPLPPIIEFVN
tara:strand:- start:42 stop:527 length:486 start_codon:yes stop_codon:yes gene_type:complete